MPSWARATARRNSGSRAAALGTAQHEDPRDHPGVVPFRRRAEIGGERGRRPVHRRAQRPVVGVLHHRDVAGRAQRQLESAPSFRRGRRARGRDHVGGDSGEGAFVVDVMRPGVRRRRARCRRISPTAARAPPGRPSAGPCRRRRVRHRRDGNREARCRRPCALPDRGWRTKGRVPAHGTARTGACPARCRRRTP